MKNKKFLAGVLIVAIVAIGGAAYFWAGVNQVSAATKTTVASNVVLDESANLTKQEKAAFKAVVASLNKLNKVTSSSTSKIKRFVVIDGYCFIKSGGTYTNVPC